MSWLSTKVQGLWSTFPATSDIWWTTVSALFLLAIALFVVGESLWLCGVRNFTAYTWFIRYTIPRPVLIWLVVAFSAFAVFIAWHFGWGKGWKTGPNN